MDIRGLEVASNFLELCEIIRERTGFNDYFILLENQSFLAPLLDQPTEITHFRSLKEGREEIKKIPYPAMLYFRTPDIEYDYSTYITILNKDSKEKFKELTLNLIKKLDSNN